MTTPTNVHFIQTDNTGEVLPLALVVYKFDGVPAHVVLVRPHCNTKANKPYRCTRESTKNMIKEELEHCDPKEAVNEVFEERGGMISAQSAGELPRGHTEAYNIRRQAQKEKLMTSMGAQRYDGSACKESRISSVPRSINSSSTSTYIFKTDTKINDI